MNRLLAVLVLALGVALAGCRVELRTEVAVRSDGSGEVAVTVVTDAEVLAAAPTLADDLALGDAIAAGWSVDGPQRTPEGGLIVVVRKPFGTIDEAQEVLAELSGPSGPFVGLSLAQGRSFATVETSFAGTGQLAGGLAAFGDAELVAALGGAPPFADAVGDRPLDEVLGVTLTLLLPGEVTSAGPAAELAADGSAATYRIPVDGSAVDLATTSRQEDADALAARRRQQLALGGLVLWVVVLAVGALVWYRRRPGPTGAGPGGGSEDPAPPPPRERPDRDRRPPQEPAPGPADRPFDPGLAPLRPPGPGAGPGTGANGR